MPAPHDEDDGWKDLLSELGVEPTPPAAKPAEPEPAAESPPPVEPMAEVEGGESLDDEGDDGEEGEGEAGAEGAPGEGEGPPGTGRKRRRRRRRRKKGAGEPAAEVAEAAPPPAAARPPRQRPQPPPEADEPAELYPTAARAREAGEDEAEELEPAFAPVGEEDTTADVLRDMIASWNVPSWDDIVRGLYRPER